LTVAAVVLAEERAQRLGRGLEPVIRDEQGFVPLSAALLVADDLVHDDGGFAGSSYWQPSHSHLGNAVAVEICEPVVGGRLHVRRTDGLGRDEVARRIAR
jgi:hypothetical protein